MKHGQATTGSPVESRPIPFRWARGWWRPRQTSRGGRRDRHGHDRRRGALQRVIDRHGGKPVGAHHDIRPPDNEWSRSDFPQQGSIHIKLHFQNQAIRIAGVGLELDAVSAAEECARHGAHQGDKRSRVRPEARQEEAEQHQPTQTGPALWQKITHNWFNSVRRGIIIYTPNRRPRRAKVGLVSGPLKNCSGALRAPLGGKVGSKTGGHRPPLRPQTDFLNGQLAQNRRRAGAGLSRSARLRPRASGPGEDEKTGKGEREKRRTPRVCKSERITDAGGPAARTALRT